MILISFQLKWIPKIIMPWQYLHYFSRHWQSRNISPVDHICLAYMMYIPVLAHPNRRLTRLSCRQKGFLKEVKSVLWLHELNQCVTSLSLNLFPKTSPLSLTKAYRETQGTRLQSLDPRGKYLPTVLVPTRLCNHFHFRKALDINNREWPEVGEKTIELWRVVAVAGAQILVSPVVIWLA